MVMKRSAGVLHLGFMLCFFAVGFLFQCGISAEASLEDGVLVLDRENFVEKVNGSKHPLLIEFYDPSCSYCKALAPKYAEIARILNTSQPRVSVAKVNGIAEKGIARQYKVNGFPFILLVIAGKGREYRGEHTSQALVTWTMKTAGPLVTNLETAADAEQFEKYEMSVVGLFEDGEEEASVAALKKVAPQVNNVLFAYSTAPSVIARYEGEGIAVPSLRMVFPHDEKMRKLSGDLQNSSEILNFVQTYRHPAVSAFSGETAEAILGDGRPLLVLFRKGNAEGLELEKTFRDVAPRLDRRMIAIVASPSYPTDQKLMQVLDVKSQELPVVRIENTKPAGRRYKKYALSGTFSETALHQFVLDYHSGTLKPLIRSAPAPAAQSGPVHSLVGSTFDGVVKDSAKDVLVYFHVPWCQPCKKLDQIFERIAKRLENVNTVVLAKMDGSVNDFDGDDLVGYPGFKFWRAHKKDEALTYDGDWTEEPLINWLSEKASLPISPEDVKPKTGKGAAQSEL